jgi:hypothetical protein
MKPTPKVNEKSREIKLAATQDERPDLTAQARRSYISNSKRGLGPDGGGWNINQAGHWSGFSPAYLRVLIGRHEAGEDIDIFPYYRCGRRVLIPRDGFKEWFNRRRGTENRATSG